MLSYTDIGHGTPLVLIHGLGQTKLAWERQHSLSSKYRLIIPDLRGHGETKIDGEITIKNFAKDVIELLEYLKIKKAYICGLSLGGIVAQEIDRQRSDMIRGLILSNTTSYVPPFALALVWEASQNYRKSGFIKAVADRGLYNKDYLEESMNTFEITDSYIDCAKAPIGISYYLHLMTVNKPILLIGAENDMVTPLINMYMTESVCRNVEVKVLKECGHLSNIEKYKEFNKIIKKFIDKC